MTPDPKPDPLPPLADAQRVLLEFFAPYDAKLAQLRAERAELLDAIAAIEMALGRRQAEAAEEAAFKLYRRIQEATS